MLTNDEWLSFSKKLEKHHAVFSKLARLGRPVFSDSVPTAAVKMNLKTRHISFLFNPDFWKSLTESERMFVVSHECLHVAYEHFGRLKLTDKRSNIAADIAVNESLVNYYGFDRPREKLGLCFVDTVFGPGTDTPLNQTAEYYYDKLVSENTDCSKYGPMDEHATEISPEMWEKIKEQFTPEELKNIENKCKKQAEGREAGKNPGQNWVSVVVNRPNPKQKWETVIKRWSQKFEFWKDEDQWIHPSRRMTLLSKDLDLPTTMEIEDPKPDRICVWFFQDTSGSCADFAQRFFDCAKSLPATKFDVKAFCFDTNVYPVDLNKGELQGFGGTSFTCIEEYIQQQTGGDPGKYPKAVFVITDGYGDVVLPQFPKNWYWFLSTDEKGCIPEESPKYNLSNFE